MHAGHLLSTGEKLAKVDKILLGSRQCDVDAPFGLFGQISSFRSFRWYKTEGLAVRAGNCCALQRQENANPQIAMKL